MSAHQFPGKITPQWRVACGLCAWTVVCDSEQQAFVVLDTHAVMDHPGWNREKPADRDSDLEVLHAMRINGGGFLSALAEAGFLADSDNLRRIKAAWPEYWHGYRVFAAADKVGKGGGK